MNKEDLLENEIIKYGALVIEQLKYDHVIKSKDFQLLTKSLKHFQKEYSDTRIFPKGIIAALFYLYDEWSTVIEDLMKQYREKYPSNLKDYLSCQYNSEMEDYLMNLPIPIEEIIDDMFDSLKYKSLVLAEEENAILNKISKLGFEIRLDLRSEKNAKYEECESLLKVLSEFAEINSNTNELSKGVVIILFDVYFFIKLEYGYASFKEGSYLYEFIFRLKKAMTEIFEKNK